MELLRSAFGQFGKAVVVDGRRHGAELVVADAVHGVAEHLPEAGRYTAQHLVAGRMPLLAVDDGQSIGVHQHEADAPERAPIEIAVKCRTRMGAGQRVVPSQLGHLALGDLALHAGRHEARERNERRLHHPELANTAGIVDAQIARERTVYLDRGRHEGGDVLAFQHLVLGGAPQGRKLVDILDDHGLARVEALDPFVYEAYGQILQEPPLRRDAQAAPLVRVRHAVALALEDVGAIGLEERSQDAQRIVEGDLKRAPSLEHPDAVDDHGAGVRQEFERLALALPLRHVEDYLQARRPPIPVHEAIAQQVMAPAHRVRELPFEEGLAGQLPVRAEWAWLVASLQHLVAQALASHHIDAVEAAALLVEVEQPMGFHVADIDELGEPIEHGMEDVLPQIHLPR